MGEATVRIFVSSTFRDMQAERDRLVLHTFPRLRHEFAARGVGMVEIDLRWGLREEDSRQGRILPLCLESIDRCRPFFLGVVGQRYGWVPDTLPPSVVGAYPHLRSATGRSVTELEMRHALEGPGAEATRALLYVQEGAAEATDGSPEARARLAALVAWLESTPHPVRRYSSPDDLARRVAADLPPLVEAEFPRHAPPTPRDAERLAHRQWQERQAREHVGRDRTLRKLDRHVAARGGGLCVSGPSGSGKTALLAAWSLRVRRPRMAAAFVGAWPASDTWPALVHFVTGEVSDPATLPDVDDARRLRSALERLVARTPPEEPALVLIDGLDALDPGQGARTLEWLPHGSTGALRIVVSARDEDLVDRLRRRGYSILRLGALSARERDAMVRRRLGRYDKRLDAHRHRSIVRHGGGRDPQYLASLTEELRVHGVHESLDQVLHAYLTCEDTPSLLDRVLQRWEGLGADDVPGGIEAPLCALATARHGHTEEELLRLAGEDEHTVPRAPWWAFRSALDPYVVVQGTTVVLASTSLRAAIARRWLGTRERLRAVHARGAALLASAEASARTHTELPWRLLHAEDFPGLRHHLEDPGTLTALSKQGGYTLRRYVQALEAAEASFDPGVLSAVARDVPAEAGSHAQEVVAALLADRGSAGEAAALLAAAAERAAPAEASRLRGLQCGVEAAHCRRTGRLAEALRLLSVAEHHLADAGYERVDLLLDLAALSSEAGEEGRLASSLAEARRLALRLEDAHGLLAADLLEAQRSLGEGDVRSTKRRLRALRERSLDLGDRAALLEVLHALATLALRSGDLRGAERSLREEEAVATELGARHALARALAAKADLLAERADYDGALACLERYEALGAEAGDVHAVIRACLLRARLIAAPDALGHPELAAADLEKAGALLERHAVEDAELRRQYETMVHWIRRAP